MTHTKKIVSALSLAALLVSSAVRAEDAPEKN